MKHRASLGLGAIAIAGWPPARPARPPLSPRLPLRRRALHRGESTAPQASRTRAPADSNHAAISAPFAVYMRTAIVGFRYAWCCGTNGLTPRSNQCLATQPTGATQLPRQLNRFT